jgi:hypothetical protein
MTSASGSHSHLGYSVSVAPNGAIKVKPGDSISAYCSAIYAISPGKTKKHWGEFGRIKRTKIIPLRNPNLINAGEIIYHIPTYNSINPAATIKKPPLKHIVIMKPKEILLDYETDIRAGSIGLLGVNDAFDLYLYISSTGNLRLNVFMKIQFFFKDSKNNKWKPNEKQKFVRDWKTAIKNNWNNKVIKVLKNGKKVSLSFSFETQIGGWMHDHWEITVTKIPKGDFKVSSVNPILGNVTLDSGDLTRVSKGCAGHTQKGAVHEFGHMLGLADEYKSSSKHVADCQSVMHSGSTTRPRHNSTMMKWLNKTLNKHGIK